MNSVNHEDGELGKRHLADDTDFKDPLMHTQMSIIKGLKHEEMMLPQMIFHSIFVLDYSTDLMRSVREEVKTYSRRLQELKTNDKY